MICTHCKRREATHFVKYKKTIYPECERCHELHKLTKQKDLTPNEVTIYLTERLLR